MGGLSVIKVYMPLSATISGMAKGQDKSSNKRRICSRDMMTKPRTRRLSVSNRGSYKCVLSNAGGNAKENLSV